jgi:hypothetical protein
MLDTRDRRRSFQRAACRWLAVLVGAAAPWLASAVALAAPERARPADDAAELVGVNTHLVYNGTVYDTAYETIVKPRLLELGARYIRDWVTTDPKHIARYHELARHGVRSLLINWDPGPAARDAVRALNGDPSRPVAMVEPANERDCDRKRDWAPTMRDFQKAMWQSYKSDPATADIPVLGPSFCNTRDSPLMLARVFPDAAQYMDRGNLHDYSGRAPELSRGGGWGIDVNRAIAEYRKLAGAKPLVSSETGYKMSEPVPNHPIVSQRAAAKYIPRTFLVHLLKGFTHVFLYQLINNTEDFGLLNEDGTPRLQFLAVRDYIELFRDPGPGFETGTLDYTLEGDTSDVWKVLLQKRDGTFYLVLWQGVNSYNSWLDWDVEPPARSLTLRLRTPIAAARTYQPSFNGTVPTSRHEHPVSVKLSVPDHLLVVELVPAGAAPSP